MRKGTGAGDAQRVQRSTGDRDRVRRPDLVECQRLGGAGRGGVGELRGVIETACAHGRFVREAALHLVRDRERRQQLAPRSARIFGGGEHGSEVVARVTGLAGGEVGVVEVEVADERAVVERGAVRSTAAAADQRAHGPSAEVVDDCANGSHRWRAQRSERAAERVEHADLQFRPRRLREVVEGARRDEAGEPRDLGHRVRLRRSSASTTASLCSVSRAA